MADKTRAVVVVLCLHVFAFQILASIMISEEMSTSATSLFLLFALLYLVLGIVLGLDLRFSRAFGFALCPSTVALWIVWLAMVQGGVTRLPRFDWFILLSIIDAFGILVGLLVLREIGRAPSVRSGP